MRYVVTAAMLLLFSQLLPAQSLTLSGQVKDQSGQALQGASVTLKQAGRDPRVKETGLDGSYVFDKLNPGAYTLEVGKPGFELLAKPVNVNQDTIENPVLAVGSQSQSITVEATLGRTTASRMDIPTSQLPVSVSTIPTMTLIEQANNDLPSVLRNAAGVQGLVWYGMYEYYTIRGFNNQDVQLVDGIRQEGNRFNTQLNNVEQVDILRGPGSVLYGPSALGGVINIIRKKPTPFKAYDLLMRAGRFKTFQLGGGINGPVFGSERVWARMDMSYFRSDAFRGAGNRRLNITPAITWMISDKHRVTFHQSLNRDNYDADSGVPFAVLNIPNAPLDRRYNTPQDFGEIRDSTNQVFYNWTIAPNWEFRNTFSYRWTNDRYLVSEELGFRAPDTITRNFLYFKHHRRPKFNQVDLTGRFDTGNVTHRVLGGWEYQDFYNFTERNSAFFTTAPINLFTFQQNFTPVNLGSPITRIDYFSNKINALYGQDHVTLFNRLRFQFAGRLDMYRRDVRRDNWRNGSFAGLNLRQRRSQDAFTYRAGAVYDITEGMNVYFAAAKSFTPVTAVPIDNRELDPENGMMYEIGHRWNLPGGRGNMYTGLFTIERNNIPLARAGGFFEQIGQQRSKGLEWEYRGNLGWNTMLTANYGFTQAWFSSFDTRTGRLPNFVPKHSAGFWATKHFGSNGFNVSFGNRYRGWSFADTNNLFRLGGFTTWDAAVAWRKSRYDWSVNFENLFNRDRYFTAAIYDSQLYPGPPINVTATVRVRLGALK